MSGISIRWNLTPKEAVQEQLRLRDAVSVRDGLGEINVVAGADVSIRRGAKEGRCGVVVLSYPDMKVLEAHVHTAEIAFPYVPGLLAFREVPILLETWRLLSTTPDLIFLDGHGYAHPRRCGFACFAGLALGIPAVGLAKSNLVGNYADPGNEEGSTSPILADNGDLLGCVVRTKTGVNPIYVSPGHRVSFDTSVRLALACAKGYRIPEPTRLAHTLVTRGSLEPR